MEIEPLLRRCVEKNASDLHLSSGLPPMMRIDGDLEYIQHPALCEEDILLGLQDTMSESVRNTFRELCEVDYSFEIEGLCRFRVNAFQQSRGPAAVFRLIPYHIMSLEELQPPPILKEIANLPRGLVLVTGPTGSGKSTTLAAIIDYINQFRKGHILTIEDPIEFVHKSQTCLINQREVNRDTLGFSQALRAALREDPNYILVGEMRDLETIRLALTAAETGHLVFSTLHTTSATKTIDRIIDVFPAGEKNVVRTMLSESLQAVIAQVLIKKIGGGRIAAHEVLLATPAIRNLIREDKVAQMYSTLQTQSGIGMQTLDQSLFNLVKQGVVEKSEAAKFAYHRQTFGQQNAPSAEPKNT